MNTKVVLLLCGVALLSPKLVLAEDAVQAKYQLTDQQMQVLKDSKISESQYPVVAAISKESGKSVEDILKMRTEQKMGWGQIAHELGIKSNIVGQSISGMHRKDDDAKHKEREEMREARKKERAERKEARNEAHSQGHEK